VGGLSFRSLADQIDLSCNEVADASGRCCDCARDSVKRVFCCGSTALLRVATHGMTKGPIGRAVTAELVNEGGMCVRLP
jgi:hypothetical protein